MNKPTYSSGEKNILWFILFSTALGQLATTIYLPAFPQMAQEFNSSDSLVQASLSLFLLGFGTSQIFYGIFSDIYGRKPILLISNTLFLIATLCMYYSHSLASFNIYRLIQGVGAGGGLIISRSMLRDTIQTDLLPHAATFSSVGFAVGIGFGPVVGGWLCKLGNFNNNTLFLLISITINLLWCLLFIPETSLKKSKFTFRTLLDIHKEILTNLQFIMLILGGVLAYSVMIAYNTISPFLTLQAFSLTSEQYGHIAIGVAFFYYFAAKFNKNVVLWVGCRNVIYMGLSCIFISGISLLLSYFFNQLSLYLWISLVLLAVFGQGLVWSNIVVWSMSILDKNTGIVSATFSGLQMLLSATFSFFFGLLSSDSFVTFALIFVALSTISATIIYYIPLSKSDNNISTL